MTKIIEMDNEQSIFVTVCSRYRSAPKGIERTLINLSHAELIDEFLFACIKTFFLEVFIPGIPGRIEKIFAEFFVFPCAVAKLLQEKIATQE